MVSNEEIQRVLLVSTPKFLGCLRTDFEKLVQSIDHLPCGITADFQNRLVLRAQDTPTTFHGRERTHNFPAVCEFPDIHFQETEQLRLIILLHELIHACQRQTILRRWDDQTMNTLREFRALANAAILMVRPATDQELREIDAEIQLFHTYFQIIFEVWNHLSMKKDYPSLFEQEMKNIHQRKSAEIDGSHFDNSNDGFMFHMHANLLEMTFFAKVTENLPISNDFQKLAEFWRDKLQSVCESGQFQKLNSVVDAMTRTSEFPNSQTLEEQYLTMVTLIRERRVFE